MRVRWIICLLVAVFAAFSSHAAFASSVISINGSVLDPAAVNCGTLGNLTTCQSTNLSGPGYLLNSLVFTFDPDPSITGFFSLTNISPTVMTFTLSATLSGLSLASPVSISGFVGAGTLTDLNGQGATLTDSGVSIYTALIDGVPVHTLLDPPQLYVSTPLASGGPGAPATIPFTSFGPSTLAQPLNSSITTAFQFRLTPGDQVSLPFAFTVEPVPAPEPGSLTLLGCGIAGLAVFRRRRLK